MVALTAGQHEGTLAHAVVVVHVLGTEVCSVDDQAALSARSPTVAFQEQSAGRKREEGEEEGGVSITTLLGDVSGEVFIFVAIEYK